MKQVNQEILEMINMELRNSGKETEGNTPL
jgi:hypothetical protein